MEKSGGFITLLGSGETSLAGGRIFETIARQISSPLRIAVLETPAGFELNSAQVAGRVREFLETRLKNFSPKADTVAARKRGTNFSPDDSHLLTPLMTANLIFMGPGSPTYAIRQLKGSLAWELIRARCRLGAALVFASAAVIAVGRWSLPVYEIYKVGEDVHAVRGLDIFADFGLKISIIPHWNNSDGGTDVDTSRCFVGSERFEQWHKLLPADETVIGLDEYTGLTFDFSTQTCSVQGLGSVTILCNGESGTFSAGIEFPVSEVGELHMPETFSHGISAAAWKLIDSGCQEVEEQPPQEVMDLLAARGRARISKDWAESDRIRERIADLGWEVQDTPTEQAISRKNSLRGAEYG